MTSYVAKSKKLFQPKAPVRRGTPSVRDSQEPSITSNASVNASPRVEDANPANKNAHKENRKQFISAEHDPEEGERSNQVATTEAQGSPRRVNASISHTNSLLPAILTATTTGANASLSADTTPAMAATSTSASQTGSSAEAPIDEASVAKHGVSGTLLTKAVSDHTGTSSPLVDDHSEQIEEGNGNGSINTPSHEEGANALLQLSQGDPSAQLSTQEAGKSSTDCNGHEAQSGARQQAMNSGTPRVRRTRTERSSTKRKSGAAVSQSASDQRQVEYPEDDIIETGAAKRSRTKGKAPAKPIVRAKTRTKNVTNESGELSTAVPEIRSPTKKRKRSGAPETAADEDPSASEADSRKNREPTPEDAEDQRIDQTTQTMANLPDLRIGRLGDRERLLRERDAQEQAQKAADDIIASRIEDYGDDGVPSDDNEAKDYLERQHEKEEKERVDAEEKQKVFEEQQEWTNTAPKRGLQRQRDDDLDEEDGEDAGEEDQEEGPAPSGLYNVVQGEIVINTNYRVKQKTKRIKITERQENDITHQMNYGKHSRKERRFVWTDEAVDRFYEGLQTFGASLDMIATIIPGTSRQNIKSKWLKEEKLNLDRLNAALKPENRLKMNIQRIEELRGKALVDTTEFYAESQRKEAALRGEKEQARQDAEAQLKGINVGDAESPGQADGDQSEQHDDARSDVQVDQLVVDADLEANEGNSSPGHVDEAVLPSIEDDGPTGITRDEATSPSRRARKSKPKANRSTRGSQAARGNTSRVKRG